MHKNIFSKIVNQIHCKNFPALLRGSVMSKKEELIQSTLYISSKIDSPGEKRLAFKRKSSDPIETVGKRPKMNFAGAVAGHGRAKHGHNDGKPYRPSSQGRGKNFDDSRRFSNDGANMRDSRDPNAFGGPSTSNDSKNPCHQNPVKNSSGSDNAPEEKSGSKDSSEDQKRELNPKNLPRLKPNEFHRVFFDVNDTSKPPKPYPPTYRDHGDNDKFVFMPCSARSFMPSDSGHGKSRWDRIQIALSANITGVFELEEVILSYNQHYKNRWNFASLHNYFDQMSDEERDTFFVKTLPKMQQLALSLPSICTESLPILRQYSNMKISITQQQAACLLANAFFCTFPNRNVKVKGGKLPDINFSNLYSGSRTERKIEKLKCLINYFKRVIEKVPIGTLTYTRQYLHHQEIPNWREDRSKMRKLEVFEKGTIEDNGDNMLQADFANKYVGGGALGQGLVQEEIRFMLCPEMILSRLFTECLTDNEVLIMTGCERFSSYTGYSDSFKFVGDFSDKTERDSWGRRSTEVVAMDALVIRNFPEQFRNQQLTRELRKAYCAFSGKYKYDEYQSHDLKLPPVCTGNWGCGAFGGDKQLKALIQLMAATLAERDVHYYTFGDGELSHDLEFLYQTIVNQCITIRNAFGLITEYGDKFQSLRSDVTLFDYIFNSLSVKRPKREVTERKSSHKGHFKNEESSD